MEVDLVAVLFWTLLSFWSLSLGMFSQVLLDIVEGLYHIMILNKPYLPGVRENQITRIGAIGLVILGIPTALTLNALIDGNTQNDSLYRLLTSLVDTLFIGFMILAIAFCRDVKNTNKV